MARKQVFRNPSTNQFIMEDATTPGGFRDLTDDEVGQLRPSKVLQEMGVSDFERFTLKNFALNPAQAHQFLAGRGYDVMRLGDGLNFAVRKGVEDPWRVVDPNKGGIGEFFRDMADLTSDVGAGIAFGFGTAAGGGLASLATGAATAAGIEATRQGIGSALGIPDNLGVGEIGLHAGLGGAAGPVLHGAGVVASKAVGAITRKLPGVAAGAQDITAFLAGKISGIKNVAGLSIGDAFVMRAQRVIGKGAAKRFERLNKPEEVLAAGREYLKVIGNKGGILERMGVARDGLIQRAKNPVIDLSDDIAEISGARVLRSVESEAGSFTGASIRESFQNAKGEAARELRNEIGSLLHGFPTKSAFRSAEGVLDQKAFQNAVIAYEESLRNVPIQTAVRIKELMHKWVNDNKGYIGVAEKGQRKALTSEVVADIRDVTFNLKTRINKIMDDTGIVDAEGRAFSEINNKLFRMIDSRNAMRDKLGDGVMGAETFVADWANAGRSDARILVKEFDELFELQLGRKINDSTLGLAFTDSVTEPFGQPGILPRLGATGQLVGPGIIGGIAGISGSDEGVSGILGRGAIGFGIGAALASPRTMVKSAPAARQFGQFLQRRAQALADLSMPSTAGRTIRALGQATLASVAKTEMGKGINRQDDTAAPIQPEVLRFVGGQ